MVDYPLETELNAAEAALDDLLARKETAIAKLRWYETTTQSDIAKKILSLRNKEDNLHTLHDHLTGKGRTNTNELTMLKPHIATLFNPLNWFNPKQRKLRSRRNLLEKANNDIEAKLYDIAMQIITIQEDIGAAESEERRYIHFDQKKQKGTIDTLTREVQAKEMEVEPIRKRKLRIDNILFPYNAEIKELQAEIDQLRIRINRANELENELSSAESSYEKAMIHKECASEFDGEVSPAVVARKLNGKLDMLNRNLDKIVKRAQSIANRLSANIKEIVIDGNNLCHDNKNKFIGFSALKNVLPEIESNYETTIIFDRSICKYRSESSVFKEFSRYVTVKIALGKADPAITMLASQRETSFILSNDKFGEFRHTKAVKENRVIRYEIYGGEIRIPDLCIPSDFAD